MRRDKTNQSVVRWNYRHSSNTADLLPTTSTPCACPVRGQTRKIIQLAAVIFSFVQTIPVCASTSVDTCNRHHRVLAVQLPETVPFGT